MGATKAEDLKIFDVTPGTNVLSASIWPGPGRVAGIRGLVQKIAFCLYTAPGEVEIDPAFGADLRGAAQGLTGANEREAKTRVTGALKKCLDDLQVDQPDDPAQQLVDLRLEELTYEPNAARWVARVQVETQQTIVEITAGT